MTINAQMIDTQNANDSQVKKVNWGQVGGFLALTFGLTWLLDLLMYLNGGLAGAGTKLMLQLEMLLPAFSAMVLGSFFYQNSPIYFKKPLGPARWFIVYFFVLTVVYTGAAVVGLLSPESIQTISLALLGFAAIGVIMLPILRLVGGKDTFQRVGMGGGKATIWLVYGLLFVLVYGLQSLLNYLLNLGTLVDLMKLSPQIAASGLPYGVLFGSLVLNTVVIGPFLGLVISFGEEYGWRGYLQTELDKLGRVRGTLLLGVIWGIWHWPVIWMGYNYPGQPVFGSLMMVGYTIVLAYVLAYAVYKSKGVWTAAYLHALNNQVLSFFMAFLVAPTSVLLSFGIGVLGLPIGLLVVLLILRDPIWRE